MRIIVLITGLLFLAVNVFAGIILNSYLYFNMALNCGVIMATTALLFTVCSIPMKDGFRISLASLFGIFGFVKFILGLHTPQQYIGNWYLIIVSVIVVIEIIVLAIAWIVSRETLPNDRHLQQENN